MGSVWQWLVALIFAAGLAFLVRRLALSVTMVVSRSMLPTIQPGDRLLTLRVHRPERLRRGDIVVFHSRELNRLMIKRLIGLPGDLIQIRPNGDLLINGIRQEEADIRRVGEPAGSWAIPDGEFYFLGDNRSESIDSRFWRQPTIPSRDIRGKVICSPFLPLPLSKTDKFHGNTIS